MLPKIEINTITSESNSDESNDVAGGSGSNGETLKQFVSKLSLSNNYERIAAIGFFKKHRENVDRFSPKEMDGWFTFCGLQKPAQMPVAFSDCRKRTGYIESLGGGKWRITTDGENLVVSKGGT